MELTIKSLHEFKKRFEEFQDKHINEWWKEWEAKATISVENFRNLKNEYLKHNKENALEFNVFNVLGVQTKETKLHSRFLAFLFDRSEDHMQGSYFFSHFITEIAHQLEQRFDKSQLAEIANGHYDVEIEHVMPSYRKIDIYIKSKTFDIAIENKIYAEDQPKQVADYYKYIKSKGKNHLLIYLTLDGKLPSYNSIGKYKIETDNIICVSYRKEIRNWLLKVKEDRNLPQRVNFIIDNYQNVITKL